jgi:hypothetical protein
MAGWHRIRLISDKINSGTGDGATEKDWADKKVVL